MDPSAVMQRYFDAFDAYDLAAICAATTDDLEIVIPFMEHDKRNFMDTMAVLFKAFPDWRMDRGRLRVGWDIVTVELSCHGTHLGALDLPGQRFLAPTGRRVVLPAQDVHYTIRGGLVSRIEPAPAAGSGIQGIVDQLTDR